MKKILTVGFIVIIFMVLITVIALTLFKDNESISVSTRLTIDSSFSGERKITYTVPSGIFESGSEEEKNFDYIIKNYCPKDMEYRKDSAGDKIEYIFTVSFSSKSDYENKLTSIFGRDTSITFSNNDTVFMSGWLLEENFESISLLYWINQGIQKEGYNNKLYLPTTNADTFVSFNGAEQKTDSVININNITGLPIQKIRIETINNKNNTYDRTIEFYILQDVYHQAEAQIKEYFSQRVNLYADSEWIQEEIGVKYKVTFKSINITELTSYTNLLLNSIYSKAEYSNISSTTLFSENDVFEENLDFSNYMGSGKSPVTVEYIYRINGNTSLAEGLVSNGDGKWNTNLVYLDENISGSCFAVKNTSNIMNIQISDGKQYKIKGVTIILNTYKGNEYGKSIEFVYDSTQAEGYNYALEYFRSKNADIEEITNESGDLICKIKAYGSVQEISTIFSRIFENDSYMSHNESAKATEASINTSMCDYIKLSAVLGTENLTVPITYKIYEQSSESILSLYYYVNGSKTDVHLDYTSDGAISFTLTYPDAEIYYYGLYPSVGKIVVIILIGLLAVAGGVVIILKLRLIPVKKYIMIDVSSNNENKLMPIKNNDVQDKKDELPWFDQIIDEDDNR